jgi:hypothetical protein
MKKKMKASMVKGDKEWTDEEVEVWRLVGTRLGLS